MCWAAVCGRCGWIGLALGRRPSHPDPKRLGSVLGDAGELTAPPHQRRLLLLVCVNGQLEGEGRSGLAALAPDVFLSCQVSTKVALTWQPLWVPTEPWFYLWPQISLPEPTSETAPVQRHLLSLDVWGQFCGLLSEIRRFSKPSAGTLCLVVIPALAAPSPSS